MTAVVYRQDGDVTAAVEDDGCDVGNHRRDALCARTRLEQLPALDEHDNRGGAT